MEWAIYGLMLYMFFGWNEGFSNSKDIELERKTRLIEFARDQLKGAKTLEQKQAVADWYASTIKATTKETK